MRLPKVPDTGSKRAEHHGRQWHVHMKHPNIPINMDKTPKLHGYCSDKTLRTPDITKKACTHTRSAKFAHARTHERVHARTHVRTDTHTHARTYVRTQTHTHARTPASTHARKYGRAHARTHTCVHKTSARQFKGLNYLDRCSITHPARHGFKPCTTTRPR